MRDLGLGILFGLLFPFIAIGLMIFIIFKLIVLLIKQ